MSHISYLAASHLQAGGANVPPPIPDVLPVTPDPDPLPAPPDAIAPIIIEPPSPAKNKPVREPVQPVPQVSCAH